MKRCALLFGGCGGRIGEALAYAAAAGVMETPSMQVILMDPDQQDPHILKCRSLMEDYTRVRRLFTQPEDEFFLDLQCDLWPEQAPADGLATLCGDQDCDQLLMKAFFSKEAARRPLSSGFGGNRFLAATAFEHLLTPDALAKDNALTRLLADTRDEDVQIVLAGSLCGGTGSAGIPALASWLRRELGDRAHLSAVLLLPYGASDRSVDAKTALQACGAEAYNMPAVLIGLPEDARVRDLPDEARLPEWLAVHAIDWLMRHDASDHAAYTYQAKSGTLSWENFGKSADLYRSGYVRLMKTAALFRLVFTPMLNQCLSRPQTLKDRLTPWFNACCRPIARMEASEKAILQEDLAALNRLMKGAWSWLEEIAATLPQEMRYADAVLVARAEALKNYQEIVELTGPLTVLDREAREQPDVQGISRAGSLEEEAELEAARHHRQMHDRLQELLAQQSRLNRRMGGTSVMRMLYDTLSDCTREAEHVRSQAQEARRRIDEAESFAAPSEQYRIVAARTRLERMERHLSMLEAREAAVRRDVEAAEKSGLRWEPPEIIGEGEQVQYGLFSPVLMRKMGRMNLKEAEEIFTSLAILPWKDEMTVKRVLSDLGKVKNSREKHPLACLFTQTMACVLEEKTT